MRLSLCVALLTLLVATPALAEEPTSLGSFRSWNSYTYNESGKKVCFMATKPTKMLPAGATRSEVYAMITHRPAENSLSVVSLVAGYSYKSGSEVKVTIGTAKFSLFTDGDTAWARDDATDRKLVAALKSGASMTVEGISTRGTKTTDTYSLAGSGAAFQAINKACGVN